MKQNCIELLSDEIWTDIFMSFLSDDFKTLSRLCTVGTRFRCLLHDENVKTCLVRDLLVANLCNTAAEPLFPSPVSWRILAFYQAVWKAGLFDENRIGYGFSSSQRSLFHNDDPLDSYIPGSSSRVHAICRILQQFDDAVVIVVARIGTDLNDIERSNHLRKRGSSDITAVMQKEYGIDVEGRLMVDWWTSATALEVARSSHKYQEVALEGTIGWAEFYV